MKKYDLKFQGSAFIKYITSVSITWVKHHSELCTVSDIARTNAAEMYCVLIH